MKLIKDNAYFEIIFKHLVVDQCGPFTGYKLESHEINFLLKTRLTSLQYSKSLTQKPILNKNTTLKCEHTSLHPTNIQRNCKL